MNVRAVAALKKPGRHADGGNLYLKISGAGTSLSKRWTFMYVVDGRQREAGLGSVASVSLAEVRRRA
ncbi:MAG TPA: Arm DNA-binding domain-containing protein, partial [Methylocella sp.]|nr:Arm DNA-binding domain-containing protein [Methylocella sp.]